MYFGARYYDQDLATWISPDPKREYHSPYTYVGNNPVNAFDPNGKATVFGQFGGTAIKGGGVTGAAGAYLNIGQDNNFGFHATGGGGLGLQGGGGVELGFVRGESANLGGAYLNINVSLGISLTLLFEHPDFAAGESARFLGGSVGLAAKAGASVSETYTVLAPLERGGGWGAAPGSNPEIVPPTQLPDVSAVSLPRPPSNSGGDNLKLEEARR